MFYSQVILARKGPLAKIWLAAHYEKKLTKQQIFATDISASVESVMNPSVPLALRVSGHLMVGIVRIYSKKVRYLMTDCTEAMWKMKLAFRPGNVDLDPATASATIDDLRHFGHFQLDEDPHNHNNNIMQGFDHLAFSAHLASDGNSVKSGVSASPSPMPSPSTRRTSGRNKQTIVPEVEGGVSRLSDVEIRRGEGSSLFAHSPHVRSPSLSNFSIHKDHSVRRSLVRDLEDDNLAAFDDRILFSGTQADYSFSAPDDAMVPASGAKNAIGSAAAVVESVQPGLVEDYLPPFDASFLDTTLPLVSEVELARERPVTPLQEEEDVEESRKEKSRREATKKNNKKRGILKVDEQIELPARVVKQRLADSQPILRRRLGDQLPFQIGGDNASDDQSIEDRLYILPRFRNVCKALQSTIDIVTGFDEFPFSSARSRNLVAEQSTPSVELTRAVAEPLSTVDRRLSSMGGEKSILEEPSAFDVDVSFASMGADLPPSSPSYFDTQPYIEPVVMSPKAPVSASKDKIAKVLQSPATATPGSKKSPIASVASPEHRMSDRTKNVLGLLKSRFEENAAKGAKATVDFEDLCSGATRKSAAGFFLECLQLKTWGLVDMKQKSAYANLSLSPVAVA